MGRAQNYNYIQENGLPIRNGQFWSIGPRARISRRLSQGSLLAVSPQPESRSDRDVDGEVERWKVRVAPDFKFGPKDFGRLPFWAHLMPAALAQFHTIFSLIVMSNGLVFLLGLCDFKETGRVVGLLWWPIRDDPCHGWWRRTTFKRLPKKQHSYALCEVFDFEIELEMGTLSQMSPNSWRLTWAMWDDFLHKFQPGFQRLPKSLIRLPSIATHAAALVWSTGLADDFSLGASTDAALEHCFPWLKGRPPFPQPRRNGTSMDLRLICGWIFSENLLAGGSSPEKIGFTMFYIGENLALVGRKVSGQAFRPVEWCQPKTQMLEWFVWYNGNLYGTSTIHGDTVWHIIGYTSNATKKNLGCVWKWRYIYHPAIAISKWEHSENPWDFRPEFSE